MLTQSSSAFVESTIVPPTSSPGGLFPSFEAANVHITDHEFSVMRDLVKSKTGISLNDTKRTLVEGRLRKILDRRNLTTFKEYCNLLETATSDDVMTEFIGRITTNFTYFNRESEHFDFFDKVILPRHAPDGSERLRVWSAGCATGPEAYDISMHIHSFFAKRGAQPSAVVLGTDISRKAIDAANHGVYLPESLKRLPAQTIENYFQSQDGRYRVGNSLRSLVKFRVLNLLRPMYPFQHKFHAIFCRNVMIYFDEETRLRLVRRLHDCLVPGGFLLLGHSESLLSRRTEFRSEGSSIYSRSE